MLLLPSNYWLTKWAVLTKGRHSRRSWRWRCSSRTLPRGSWTQWWFQPGLRDSTARWARGQVLRTGKACDMLKHVNWMPVQFIRTKSAVFHFQNKGAADQGRVPDALGSLHSCGATDSLISKQQKLLLPHYPITCEGVRDASIPHRSSGSRQVSVPSGRQGHLHSRWEMCPRWREQQGQSMTRTQESGLSGPSLFLTWPEAALS